jgi:hypothetical protein
MVAMGSYGFWGVGVVAKNPVDNRTFLLHPQLLNVSGCKPDLTLCLSRRSGMCPVDNRTFL